jgi:hypothetical protein
MKNRLKKEFLPLTDEEQARVLEYLPLARGRARYSTESTRLVTSWGISR